MHEIDGSRPARAAQAGFLCEGVWHEEEGHYLARLKLFRNGS
jgi:hypothetical protein